MNLINFIKKQIKDIKTRPKTIINKFKTLLNLLYKYLFFPINLILALLIIISSRFILIRIGFFKTKWIGEFVFSAEIHLINRKISKTKTFDIFVSDTIVTNLFFLKKVKKKIRIINHNFYNLYKILKFLSEKKKYFKKHIINYLENHSHEAYQLPDLNNQIIKLNDQEVLYGYKILDEKIKKNYKGIVLFCVRDYYNNQTLYPYTDWSSNNFRNYKFEDFIPSIELLNSNNYLVIRMGNLNERKIVLNNNLFIDYSFSDWKSDFMDNFLGYACSFCITTGTGSDAFAKLNRKRIGCVINPLTHIYDRNNWTYIFGYLKNKTTNKYLTIDEIIKEELSNSSNLKKINETYILEKNKSEDITQLVLETMLKHENKFNFSDVNYDLQKSFWDKTSKLSEKRFENIKEFKKLDNRICNSFLIKNKDIFGL